MDHRYIVVEIIETVPVPAINHEGGYCTTAYSFPSEEKAQLYIMQRLKDWRGAKVETKPTSDMGKWYDGMEYAVSTEKGDSIRLQLLFDRSQLAEALERNKV